MIKVENDENQVGQRLDLFIANKLPEFSRSFIQKLADDKKVLVNENPEKAAYKLKNQDKIKLDFSRNKFKAKAIDLPIIYEDDDCIVIDKPSGILTHSKGPFNPEPTVASFLQSRVRTFDGVRDGIVHRLDRGTSGVIIVAKSKPAQKWLQKQFSSRKVRKVYYAVVKGKPDPDKAIIDMPIERDPKHPQRFRTSTRGRPANTKYTVMKVKNDYSLLMLEPVTGRTHQLRVHLKTVHHPIIGDLIYGGEPAERLYLHATELELTLPSKKRSVFKSDIPKKFNTLDGDF